MTIAYSAPAKLILSGEHSVVYGKPALISALNLRLTVTVREAQKTNLDNNLQVILRNVQEWLSSNNEPHEKKNVAIHISSDIPSRQNLGSSAALSVATSAALLHFLTGRAFPKEIINKVAYQSEKHFHGNPSGGDNSASCYGGFIYYRKEFEFLKTISSLSVKIPRPIMNRLFIIDSGKSSEPTAEMVAKVGTFYNDHPKKAETIMSEIEKVTKRMVIAIVKEDPNMFAQAVQDNERHLEDIGVVSEKTKNLLKTLSPYGVGKVTGGGGFKSGSGNLLFFAQNPDEAIQYFTKEKIKVIKFIQDFAGVKQENTS